MFHHESSQDQILKEKTCDSNVSATIVTGNKQI